MPFGSILRWLNKRFDWGLQLRLLSPSFRRSTVSFKECKENILLCVKYNTYNSVLTKTYEATAECVNTAGGQCVALETYSCRLAIKFRINDKLHSKFSLKHSIALMALIPWRPITPIHSFYIYILQLLTLAVLIRAEMEVLVQQWSPNSNVFVHWDTRETDVKVKVFN